MRGRGGNLTLALVVAAVISTAVGCAGVASSSGPNPNPVAPSLVTQPSSKTVTVGQPATFSALATGISGQPANQTVTTGQPATFSVVASGTAPLTYQWRKNGTGISGATSSTYTTPATTSGDNGATFAAVVSNSAGSVTSNAATLTVSPAAVAPTISRQPANQTVTTGQPAIFSVVASGTAPLTYQWRKNGTGISGATSSTYTTPATTSADNGATFVAVISNSVGSATSNPATLTVSSAAVAPTISGQPANQTGTV